MNKDNIVNLYIKAIFLFIDFGNITLSCFSENTVLW